MSDMPSFDRARVVSWVDSFGGRTPEATFQPWRELQPDEPADTADTAETAQADAAAEPEPADAAAETEPPVDLAQVRAESFARGFEEGRRTVELEVASERAALARLAEALETLRPEPTGALAVLLAETVERLVRQVVGAAPVDPALLASRVEAAAAIIGEEVSPARLWLHPDDLPLLDAARLPVQLIGDPGLARGSLVLECATGWIEDGPAVRLDRLRAELDKMGAWQ